MNIWKKLTVYSCGIMLTLGIISAAVTAGGPAVKDNACGACHQDYNKIIPSHHPDIGKGAPCMICHAPDPSKNEPTKFSTEVHKAHQGGKTKLECSSCHTM